MITKHPPGEPMTLGNMRWQGVPSAKALGVALASFPGRGLSDEGRPRKRAAASFYE
jgi:hypothetical protein